MNAGCRILFLTMCVAVVVTGPAWAGPDDFVRGRMIEIEGGELVLKVGVPADVYEWVSRSDLGDLRVLNGDGGEVPYALRRPESTEEFSAWIDLPLFPLPSTDIGTRGAAQVNVEVDEGGAVVAVNSFVTDQLQPAAFLLDFSGIERALTGLRVTWEMGEAGDGDFVGKFKIDFSDDLNRWRTLVASTTLASLAAGDRQLTSEPLVMNEIQLPGFEGRYLRITQIDGSERMHISGVQGRSRQAQLPQRQWKMLSGTAVDEGFEFTTNGLFPLDRVRVELDEPTYMVSVSLLSRPRADVVWRNRGKRLFYRVDVNGVTVASDSASAGARDQFWRVEVTGGSMSPPRLNVGWLPDEVVFLPQGDGPFLLAYGQAGMKGRQWPIEDLLEKLGKDVDLASVQKVSLSAATTLGGPDRLILRPEPIDWQTVVLWVLLVAGVSVVGFFAYRLLKT